MKRNKFVMQTFLVVENVLFTIPELTISFICICIEWWEIKTVGDSTAT